MEFRHIEEEFERVALAHPEISFYLHHNNQEIYALSPANHRKRIQRREPTRHPQRK
jgi:DNA mismatch repair protein MutL